MNTSPFTRRKELSVWPIHCIFLLLVCSSFSVSAFTAPTTTTTLTSFGRAFQQNQCTPAPTSRATRLHLSFNDVVSTYDHCLKYHYFPTQSVTNAVLTAVGDGIAQSVEANENENNPQQPKDANAVSSYDPKRGLVYFFKGLGSGILWAWWFDFAEVWSVELTRSALSHLDSVADFLSRGSTSLEYATDATAGSIPSTTMLSVKAQALRTAINISLEQFLVCPFVFSFWDIPVTGVMRGAKPDEIPAQIRQKLPPLFVANAKVWTGVNIVTYNIPLEYRLLFTSAASIVSESINAGITSQQVAPVVLSSSTVATPIPVGRVNATAIQTA